MFEAPFPPYDPTDKLGFSFETVVRRWPVIITGVLDQVNHVIHDLSMQDQSCSDDAKQSEISEGKEIIVKISKLKYNMGHDFPLEPIPNDGGLNREEFNAELEILHSAGKDTWFTAPWLYAECYLYRLLRAFFAQTVSWNTFDPFTIQKLDTFKGSGVAIHKIATTMHELDDNKASLGSDPAKLAVLFNEMLQMCLWGNATDLSLLTHLTTEDITRLQSVGKEAQDARKEFILRDDSANVWDQLQTMKEGRVDFVLDNAGFELYTDLVLADFFVTHTPYVSQVVFHPKLIPWFVSDVTPKDFKDTFAALLDSEFLPPSSGSEHLKTMVSRWKSHLDSGAFKLSVPTDTPLVVSQNDSDPSIMSASFWTTPWPYWDMKTRNHNLWSDLNKSGLVIFKGDLNYRKLTGDVKWPAFTPFTDSLGPLAGSFPLLSLRTNKADVVVGVEKDVADRLEASDDKWRVNGRYALISFSPRTSHL